MLRPRFTSTMPLSDRLILAFIFAALALNVSNQATGNSGSGGTGGRRDDLLIDTKNGTVRGQRYYLPNFGKSVDEFLGIPFAKPPLGQLRFRHPLPADNWTGVYNAFKLPNACYQTPDEQFGSDFYGSNVWNVPANINVSEDCLYLNVWLPTRQSRSQPKLAVMVWIYGGSFLSGTAALSIYDGRILATQNNVVLVTLNYRLGAFGFLAMGQPSAPGNAGLFDQLKALEWVQENIGFFGGDKRNVTLFGESAGSVSVSLHLLSPLSRSMFHRAVMQSGTANMPWGTLTMAEATRRGVELAGDYLRCNYMDSVENMIDHCLLRTSADRLARDQYVSRGVMQFPFLPVVDGFFLVEMPELSLLRRNFKRCPILLGSNMNEGSWLLVYELPTRLTLTSAQMNEHEFLESINELFHFYLQYPQENNFFGLEAITFQYKNWMAVNDTLANVRALDNALGDCHFLCHVNRFALAYAASGLPVYSYFLTHRYSTNPWPHWMGVMHGDDVFLLFGEALKDDSNFTQEDKMMSRTMMAYWSNFAKTGDPNQPAAGFKLNKWPLHTPGRREYLELNAKFLNDVDSTRAIGQNLRAKECAFWLDYLPRLVASTVDITVAEQAWKLKFNEWSTKYIVEWKLRYDNFIHEGKHCDDNT